VISLIRVFEIKKSMYPVVPSSPDTLKLKVLFSESKVNDETVELEVTDSRFWLSIGVIAKVTVFTAA